MLKDTCEWRQVCESNSLLQACPTGDIAYASARQQRRQKRNMQSTHRQAVNRLLGHRDRHVCDTQNTFAIRYHAQASRASLALGCSEHAEQSGGQSKQARPWRRVTFPICRLIQHRSSELSPECKVRCKSGNRCDGSSLSAYSHFGAQGKGGLLPGISRNIKV